ncbi:MAG: hypothetical protein AABZ23_00700 [Deltaproteobacteria bacterium]
MNYTCDVINCSSEAKVNGKCVSHAREEIIVLRGQAGGNKALKEGKTEEKTLLLPNGETEACCKECGVKASEVTFFNKKKKICKRCYQRLWSRKKYAGRVGEKPKKGIKTMDSRLRGNDEQKKKANHGGLCGADDNIVKSAPTEELRLQRIASSASQDDDLDAVRVVAKTLAPFDEPTRERILRWAGEKLENKA